MHTIARALLAGVAVSIAALTGMATLPVKADLASTTWSELKPDVFGDREILPGGGVLTMAAPSRPEDQRAVPVTMKTRLSDGRTIKSVTFIVDENPSPVAAVFKMGPDRTAMELAVNLRFNTGTFIRTIVEASDGKLYMVKRYVKFAGGQSACSAPPTGNPEEIAANMGKMSLTPKVKTTAATALRRKMQLRVSHPNNTGMALDQQTLLYIPLRMVTDLEVRQGDERVFAMAGSISLSENPIIDFDYRSNGAEKMHVQLKDSDKTLWEHEFPVGTGS
ncbi:MAG: quinoprotein dehydrogenase-associated SoxYZ-like carrier [Hyphomicrobiaceae bacterium]